MSIDEEELNYDCRIKLDDVQKRMAVVWLLENAVQYQTDHDLLIFFCT